jgi:transcriptional regulator with XRE-family HTH domain
MPPTDRFFTKEMGGLLHNLRKRKGLTQDQVAERIGLKGKGRWNLISALEKGRIHNPTLKLVTLYLRAVGAPFSEFLDTLTRVVPVEIDPREVAADWLTPERQAHILRRTEREVQNYQMRIAYPIKPAPPVKPGNQSMAVERLKRYRIQENTIQQAVTDMLDEAGFKAIAEHREPSVLWHSYWPYIALVRVVLKLLRRIPEPDLTQQLDNLTREYGTRGLNPDVLNAEWEIIIRCYRELTTEG